MGATIVYKSVPFTTFCGLVAVSKKEGGLYVSFEYERKEQEIHSTHIQCNIFQTGFGSPALLNNGAGSFVCIHEHVPRETSV